MYAASYSRPRQDPRLELCQLTHAGPLPAPWLASGFVLNLVVEGEADLLSRGAVNRVGKGDVVLANPGQLRAVTRRYSPLAATRSLTIEESQLREALRSRVRDARVAHFEHATTRDAALHHALGTFYGVLQEGAPRLLVQSAVEALLDQMCRMLRLEVHTRWPSHPAVRRAREYIEDHVAADIGLSELVDVAGLSRAHLIREFRRQVGLPPHQYQIHARIRRARQLLAAGRPVADVAAVTGFFDQAHFTRHFRRLLGVSPVAYRRAAGAPSAL
jgi:AraC-like DNA-binding protein